MKAIFAYWGSLIEGIWSILRVIFWLISGLVNLVGVLTDSINILADVLQFFPVSISSTLVAILGGLVVFRIFGRS